MRADAGAEMGAGHVMRCLALAQAWQDQGGEVVFAVAQAPPALESRLLAEGMEVVRLAAPPGSAEDARETAVLARERGARWLVVDGYQFGADYQHLVKEAGLALLFIDDYGHAEHYWADVVLNQNIYAHKGLYPKRESYTRLLLGTRYALLRREFLKWRDWQREIPEVARKILVTLGGGDPANVTLKVIQALSLVETDGLEVVVVAGVVNPHFQELQAAANNLPHRMRLLTNVDQMAELMAWADLAVSGAGSTCWEIAFMGLPNLTIILSDDQAPIAEQLGMKGVAVNLRRHESLHQTTISLSLQRLLTFEKMRLKISLSGRELVDGDGGDRVVMELLN